FANDGAADGRADGKVRRCAGNGFGGAGMSFILFTTEARRHGGAFEPTRKLAGKPREKPKLDGSSRSLTAPGVTLQSGDALAPSPLPAMSVVESYSGERVGVRGGSSSGAARKNGPSPQPSPPSTGER